ncbi:homoserine dehydrogenase, partial [Bacillus cereus group sp. BceL239]
EFNKMKCTVTSEKKKNNILSRLQLIYQNMKSDKQYPLAVAFDSKLLEQLEKEPLHTIEDGVTCLHLMLDVNYEKIKQYGSSTSRSFVPLSQSSICLADCICLTGVVVGLLGAISFGGLLLSICSIT